MCSGYPLVSNKLAKILGFKGHPPIPLSPTPRSKRELGQPLLSRERAKLRGRGKTEKWDSPLHFIPLSPTPRSKRELGQPLLSRERAKLRGRGKTEKWDSPLHFSLALGSSYVCETRGWCVFNSYWTLEGALSQKIHRSSHRSSKLFFHRDMDK